MGVSLFIAIAQLSSLPPYPSKQPQASTMAGKSEKEVLAHTQRQLDGVEVLLTRSTAEVGKLISMEAAPFFEEEDEDPGIDNPFEPSSSVGSNTGLSAVLEGRTANRQGRQLKRLLAERMKEWLVQTQVRGVPGVRDAEGRALARRRVGAPHGAKGTL
jgi:hypothetical protein